MDTSNHATGGGAVEPSASAEDEAMGNMLQKSGWTKLKQLTTQEHWL